MTRPMIEVNNASVIYDGQKGKTDAIRGVDFDIEKSDFIVILGPSGCGKSTLLNLLAGFIFPTEGEILMHGEKIKGPGRDRGVVFQSTNLFPWLNVRQNIQYGLRINDVDKKERDRLTDIYLKKIGLEDYDMHYPFELSGGMQQRVALARTMINNPEILLMDEPFGALDAITRDSMQDFVRELWAKDNQTFFMITHDIDEALSLGNRVIVMSASPGTIKKQFEVDFYKKMLEDPEYVPGLDPDFIEIKEEILKIIHKETK